MCAVILRLLKVSRLLEVSQSFIISVPLFFFFNISQVSDKFAFSLFDLDWDVFMQHIEGAVNRVPALEQTGIKSTVCGPGTHTHTHTHMLSCVPITSWGITFTEVISWRLYLQPPNTNPSTNLKLKVYMLRCRYVFNITGIYVPKNKAGHLFVTMCKHTYISPQEKCNHAHIQALVQKKH